MKNKKMVKILLVTSGLIVLFLATIIASVYMDRAKGDKKYKEAIQHCGHTPIVYNHDDYAFQFEAPNPRLELADSFNASPDNEYYCTLTEASNNGRNEAEINRVRDSIENRDDIPANIKSEYR